MFSKWRKYSSLLLLMAVGVLGVGAGSVLQRYLVPVDQVPSQESGLEEDVSALQLQLNTSRLIPAPSHVPAFSLSTSGDKQFTETGLLNRWSIFVFGFVSCPDVCPATLQRLAITLQTIDSLGLAAPQVIFATVDPQRDSIDVMENYVKHFDRRFIPLTGEASAVETFYQSLDIVAEKRYDNDGGEGYTVDHTASLLLVDPGGYLVARINPPFITDQLVSDYKLISQSSLP